MSQSWQNFLHLEIRLLRIPSITTLRIHKLYYQFINMDSEANETSRSDLSELSSTQIDDEIDEDEPLTADDASSASSSLSAQELFDKRHPKRRKQRKIETWKHHVPVYHTRVERISTVTSTSIVSTANGVALYRTHLSTSVYMVLIQTNALHSAKLLQRILYQLPSQNQNS